jgi:hypothetical protein
MNRASLMGILVLLLMSAISCSRSASAIDQFSAVWDESMPDGLKIERTVGNRDKGFAVFAKLRQADFEAFKKAMPHYKSWNRLDDGMSFEVGGIELRSPTDISGIYSVGDRNDGFVKVIVWDERTETVVLMLASGII